jgi:hypothetical protein
LLRLGLFVILESPAGHVPVTWSGRKVFSGIVILNGFA